MDPTMISILAFFTVTGVIVAVVMIISDMSPNKAEDRLQSITTGRRQEKGTGGVDSILKLSHQAVKDGNLLNGLINRSKFVHRLLEQSDCGMTIDKFVLVSALCAGLGAAGCVIAKAPPALFPVGALGMGFLPMMYLKSRRSWRVGRFVKQLPDAMELIGRALRSGHSLGSSLHLVIEEMPEPISKEFRMAYEEQNLGVSIEMALKNVYRRVPNMDFKFFVTAVSIQRQTGGDLAEILDKLSHIIRERFRIQGVVQALTGEGRLSAIVLMGMPIALFIMMYYLDKDYIMMLFTEEVGRQMLAGAVFAQILGAYVIKKIIQIKI